VKDRLLLALAPPLAALLVRGLRLVTRLEWRRREIAEGMVARGERFIMAFWHGQLLMMPYAYLGPRMTALFSEHRDGELVGRTMARLGFIHTRGSSTQGGARGMRQLVRLARQGFDVAITPDGPRGPRHVVQRGVIELARLTGLPILPVAFDARKKKLCAPGTGS